MTEHAPEALGFLAGVAFSACVYALVIHGPLARTSRACALLRAGDLSRTVPEVGPLHLRRIAQAVNDMAADFQEVLLLFAHMVHAAADAGASAEIEEMSALIRDFRYFRVAIENGTIRDTGIVATTLSSDTPGKQPAPELRQPATPTPAASRA